jgi:hypothetical protein
MIETNKTAYKKLLLAVIRQWKDDGKPRYAEQTIADYFTLLQQSGLCSRKAYYKKGTVSVEDMYAQFRQG